MEEENVMQDDSDKDAMSVTVPEHRMADANGELEQCESDKVESENFKCSDEWKGIKHELLHNENQVMYDCLEKDKCSDKNEDDGDKIQQENDQFRHCSPPNYESNSCMNSRDLIEGSSNVVMDNETNDKESVLVDNRSHSEESSFGSKELNGDKFKVLTNSEHSGNADEQCLEDSIPPPVKSTPCHMPLSELPIQSGQLELDSPQTTSTDQPELLASNENIPHAVTFSQLQPLEVTAEDDEDYQSISLFQSTNVPKNHPLSSPHNLSEQEMTSKGLPSVSKEPSRVNASLSPSSLTGTVSLDTSLDKINSTAVDESESSASILEHNGRTDCKDEPMDNDEGDDCEVEYVSDGGGDENRLNGSSELLPPSSTDIPAPTRIQYVFINKPQKKKVKKKKFGVLYSQAFRHFQKVKMKFPSMFGKPKKEKIKEEKKVKKKEIPKQEEWKEKFLLRGSTVKKDIQSKKKSKKSEESKKKSNNNKKTLIEKPKKGRGRGKSKGEGREKNKVETRGRPRKSKNEGTSKKERKGKSDEKIKIKIENISHTKSGRKCTRGSYTYEEFDTYEDYDDDNDEDYVATIWKNSKRAKRSTRNDVEAKSIRRRLLTPEEEDDVKTALTQPGATIDSVSNQFGIAKTIVRKFSPVEDEVVVKREKKEKKEKKRKKKKEKTKQPKEENPVVVKEETPDYPLTWEYQNNEEKHSTNDNDEGENENHSLDDSYEPFIPKSFRPRVRPRIGTKYRKELTLNEKIKAIHELQKKDSKITQVAKKFGISSSAVSRLNKARHSILLKAESGDLCGHLKRTRDCKAPELDKALLKWYKSIEQASENPISLTNVLLREKSHDIAMAMGCGYLPTLNWILRWKYRHNIVCKKGRIECREDLDPFDKKVDMAAVLSSVEAELLYHSQMLENGIKEERQEEYVICEHCGVPIYNKRSKKRTSHQKECPLYSRRKDLTLGEKVKVLKALERPGIKMSHVARKFGISSSAISRIHKDKIEILSCYNEGYINMDRKRSRVSKEPEVERALCDWYRNQYELGIHVSSLSVREKAKEIASSMGKEFTPSESWVFRWRHRNYVHGPMDNEEMEEEEEEEEMEMKVDTTEDQKPLIEIENGEDGVILDEQTGETKKKKRKRKRKTEDDGMEKEPKKKKIIFPKSVMCEKCGCVSVRLANNRIRSMRHSRGCPLLKPRNEMNYEFRIKMLQELEEPGATLSSVGRKYGVSTSSMSRMKQNKDSIISSDPDQRHKKRIRECKEPEVAKQLYSWYMEKLSEGIHVTGTKLKAKASEMAREEGRDFKVSTGWLGRWKNRYNILFKQQDGYQREKVTRKEGSGTRRRSKKTVAPNPIPIVYEKREPETFESPVSSEYAHHTTTEMTNVNMAEVAQSLPAPRMFFTRGYPQNPWDLAQQASTSCARPKDFIATVTHTIPAEENQGTYTYDPLTNTARHMFHHTLETFALTNGYPVTMGVGAEPLATRDFLQPDENELHQQQGIVISSTPSSSAGVVAAAVASSSTSIHPSHPNLIHQQPPHAHTNNIQQAPLAPSILNHHHHHLHRNQHLLPQQPQQQPQPPPPPPPQQQQQLTPPQPTVLNLQHQQHQPQQQHQQQQQQQQPQHSASPAMMMPDEEEEQDPAVMEAFKIMSSYVQKKSLGADVQNALRTMQMAMKSQPGAGGVHRKGIKRNTYTNI